MSLRLELSEDEENQSIDEEELQHSAAAAANSASEGEGNWAEGEKSFIRLPKYTIPKRKNGDKSLIQPIDLDSRVFLDEILPMIKQCWFEPKKSEPRFKFTECYQIKNEDLTKRFDEKKREMTKMYQEKVVSQKTKIYNEKELAVTPGFLQIFSESEIQSIAQEGLYISSSSSGSLGNPEMGVYLSRFADVLTSTALIPGVSSGTFIICKTLKGRVKAVSGSLDPTPSFDCHIGKELSSQISSRSAPELFQALQAYYYEYDEDGNLLPCPRTVLPFAVIKYSYVEAENEKSPKNLVGKGLSLWSGSLDCGNKANSIFDVQLVANFATLKPFELGKSLLIRKLVALDTVAQWAPIKELSEPDNCGRLARKREIKLNATEMVSYVSYYRLIGSNPQSQAQLNEFSDKLLNSKGVGLSTIRKGTTMLVMPNSEFSSSLGIPSMLEYEGADKVLHCIFISYRSFSSVRNLPANNPLDQSLPSQSVIGSFQLNCDRLQSLFSHTFDQLLKKPVGSEPLEKSMKEMIDMSKVKTAVVRETNPEIIVSTQSSAAVNTSVAAHMDSDEPVLLQPVPLRSLPMPPLILSDNEEEIISDDDDNISDNGMMEIISRPTALGGSLLSTPIIPVGDVQPIMVDDDGDRPYDPDEEDRLMGNFSYVDYSSNVSLNSDNLARLREHSELVAVRGEADSDVSYLSRPNVFATDTPSSPTHGSPDDTAGPSGNNPVILPLEDRRYISRDVDLRIPPVVETPIVNAPSKDVDERAPQQGTYRRLTSAIPEVNKRLSGDDPRGSSKRPRSAGLLPNPPEFAISPFHGDVDMRRPVPLAVVLPVPKVFNVPPPPTDFSAPPPGYPVINREANPMDMAIPNLLEGSSSCQATGNRSGVVRDTEVLGGGVQEAIVSSTTPDHSVSAGQVGQIGLGEAEIEANSKLTEAQKYQQILTDIRSKVLDWLAQCPDDPLLPTQLAPEEILADPRLHWDVEVWDDDEFDLLSQTSEELKRQAESVGKKTVLTPTGYRLSRTEESQMKESRPSWIPTEALKDHPIAPPPPQLPICAVENPFEADSVRSSLLRSPVRPVQNVPEKSVPIAVIEHPEDINIDQTEDISTEPLSALQQQIIFGRVTNPSLISLIPPVVAACLRDSTPSPTHRQAQLAIESLNQMVEDTSPSEPTLIRDVIEKELLTEPQPPEQPVVEFAHLLEDSDDDESWTLADQMRKETAETKVDQLEQNADDIVVVPEAEPPVEFPSPVEPAFSEISQPIDETVGQHQNLTPAASDTVDLLAMEIVADEKPEEKLDLLDQRVDEVETVEERPVLNTSVKGITPSPPLVPVETVNNEQIWAEAIGDVGEVAVGPQSVASADATDLMEMFGGNFVAIVPKQQRRQLLPAKLFKSTLPSAIVEDNNSSSEAPLDLNCIPPPPDVLILESPVEPKPVESPLIVRCEEIPMPPEPSRNDVERGVDSSVTLHRPFDSHSFSSVSSEMNDFCSVGEVVSQPHVVNGDVAEHLVDEEVLDVGCDELAVDSPAIRLDYDDDISAVEDKEELSKSEQPNKRKLVEIESEPEEILDDSIDTPASPQLDSFKTQLLKDFDSILTSTAVQICESCKDRPNGHAKVPLFSAELSPQLMAVMAGFKRKMDSTLSCCQKLEEQKFRKSIQDAVKVVQTDDIEFDRVLNAAQKRFFSDLQSTAEGSLEQLPLPNKRISKKLTKKLKKVADKVTKKLKATSGGLFMGSISSDNSSVSGDEDILEERKLVEKRRSDSPESAQSCLDGMFGWENKMPVETEEPNINGESGNDADVVWSIFPPLNPERYEIPLESLSEKTRGVVCRLDDIKCLLVEMFIRQMEDPMANGPFQWPSSSDVEKMNRRRVTNETTTPCPESASRGVVIPDDKVMIRANPADVKKIFDRFVEWRQLGVADWHLKLHSQVVLELAKYKYSLPSSNPNFTRVVELLSLLPEYRKLGVVKLMDKHPCDLVAMPTLNYLPCVQKIKAEMNSSATCVMLSNLNPTAPNAAGFHLNNIEVMNIPMFIERIVDANLM